jgi:hypothetical protein
VETVPWGMSAMLTAKPAPIQNTTNERLRKV